ncbi:MAG TPA: endonuclease NucS domain-containing protein [Nitrososphaerales archaeon]|nr:endonuclease NucS domain-containing protein [Nitrososphaerales archaeon]
MKQASQEERTKYSVGLDLYFDSLSEYKTDVKVAIDAIRETAGALDMSLVACDVSQITDQERTSIESRIRAIIPQMRGSIRSSRNAILPLSGNGNLNVTNTAIMIIKSEEKDLYVFPCRLGETYYSLSDGFEYLRSNFPSLPVLDWQSEKEIASNILRNPDLIEEGLHEPRQEEETGAGKIDLVFTDRNGRDLLVEVEREADDAPLGQILRLCAGYLRLHSLPGESIRGMIACMRARSFVIHAAEMAGIEVKVLAERSVSEESSKSSPIK